MLHSGRGLSSSSYLTRERYLRHEYEQIGPSLPHGLYITPRVATLEGISHNVTRGWNGVIFINQGVYEGGVFKFRIDFPLQYPLKLP